MPEKWPSRSQWKQILKILDRKERRIFFVLSFLLLSSLLFLCFDFYFKNTTVKPARYGSYTEGIVGSPRLINPIYSAASDVDRDLTELIYSGLMKYDVNGKLVLDLAKEYKTEEDGRIYDFTLKEKIYWSDGKPITADDIVFTIKTIQNPSYKSPIRASWLGVKVEKTSDLAVRFELKNPSAVFLESCTLKIMPRHIWENISSQNFSLSSYNLKPIGSGPYKIRKVSQDDENNVKSIEMIPNFRYAGNQPNLNRIKFVFFKEEKELLKAAKSKDIDGFSTASIKDYKSFLRKGFALNKLSLPRYFAVFFNPDFQNDGEKILSDPKVRQALIYATNKQEIVEKVLLSNGQTVNSPILPGIYGFSEPKTLQEFNQEKAKQLLDEAGFKETENGREKASKKEPAFQFKSDLKLGSQGTEVQELQKCLASQGVEIYPEKEVSGYFGEKTRSAVIRFQEKYRSEILESSGLTAGTGDVKKSTRTKLNEICAAPTKKTILLSLTLTTVNQPILVEAANMIKKQWEAAGIKVEVKTYSIVSLGEDVIKPRNYEMLLFGEVLGSIADPYAFWHSSQVKDPGLNLAGYESKESDKLLENSRQTLDEETRKTYLEKFQDNLLSSFSCLFLYNPDYAYFVSKDIKGIDTKLITEPSQRFGNMENWYIKTKRTWKWMN